MVWYVANPQRKANSSGPLDQGKRPSPVHSPPIIRSPPEPHASRILSRTGPSLADRTARNTFLSLNRW